jgi:uncharacterized protein YndB with AHSA1/START domain
MKNTLVATAHVEIDAPIATVWDALVNPEKIRQYMFGTTVVSAWREGAGIVWKGEWQGRPYEDKGVILRLQPFQPAFRAARPATKLPYGNDCTLTSGSRCTCYIVPGQQRD